MPIIRNLQPALAKWFVLFGVVTGGTAVAQEPIALPEVGGTTRSVPHDINNNRVIVGTTIDNLTQRSFPVRWVNDTPQLLSITSPGTARSINDAGVIVGSLDGPDGLSQPTVWVDGQALTLPVPANSSVTNYGGMASDINEAGDVVGWTYLNGLPRATIWSNGKGTALPGLSDQLPAFAFTIDNEGVVYGTAVEPGSNAVVGVRWINGQISRLVSSFTDQLSVQITYPTDAGGGRVGGYSPFENHLLEGVIIEADRAFTFRANTDVNNLQIFGANSRGEFVGYFQANSGNYVPVQVTPEGLSRIPLAESRSALAYGNNDTGQIVGCEINPVTGVTSPVRWDLTQFDMVQMGNAQGTPGQNLRMVARVMRGGTPVRGRSVRFQLGAQFIGNAVSDSTGVASLWTTVPPSSTTGTHEIMGSLGGSNYVKRRLVIGVQNTSIGVSGFVTRPGRTHLLTARLWSVGLDRPIAGKTVSFRIGRNVVGTAVTDSSGRARLSYTIPSTSLAGSFDYVVRFEGDTMLKRAQGSTLIRVNR